MSFFFLFTFFVFIFTVINVTNFNVWIIKILVLSPKQSKRMFFRQNLFSDCCSLLNQGGPKWFFPCRKGRGYKVFPYWQNAGSPHPQVKNLLTLPHLESRPPPPPPPPPHLILIPSQLSEKAWYQGCSHNFFATIVKWLRVWVCYDPSTRSMTEIQWGLG